MANTILIKSKGDAVTVPASDALKIAELGVNTYDGRVYLGTKLGTSGTAGGTATAATNIGAPILDEDNLSSDSATSLATQQSIKAYVDAQGGGVSLSGSTNNTIATVTGSNALAGEANFTFDGTNALIASTGQLQFRDGNSYLYSNAANDLEVVATDITLDAATLIDLQSDAIYLGEDGNTDVVLTFKGNDSDGVLTWMEDEDHFKFSDDIVIEEKLYIDDEGGEYISGDGSTATLTGAWASANMTITGGAVSGITDLAVADGGTGASSLTDGGVLLGSGTGAITAMAVLGDGEMIVGDGTTDPVAESGATLRTSIGVGTGDSPTFAGLSVGDGNITNAGDINCDSISVDAAGTGLNIDFSGGNTATSAITIADNLAEALVIQQGSNDYLDICTSNGSETVHLGHGVSGTAITIGHSTSETTIADNLTVSGDLAVSGTTTTVAQIVGAVANAIVFEGATADSYETTLAVVDPTSDDNTVYLPDATGYTALLADATTTDGAVTQAEFALLDGGSTVGTTAVANGDGILTNDGGTMRQTTVQTFQTYFDANSVGGSGIVTTGALDSGSITSGFGTINTGSSTITSTGAITGGSLVADDVTINGKVITMTGSSSDTVVMTAAANGAFSLVTTDDAAAAANIQITADGTVDIDSAGVLTLDSGAAINIEPASGSAILLDGTISIDAGVVTGATSITSTAFVGDITGDVTGTADTATVGTNVTVSANNTADETTYICFVDGATGTQGIETDSALTYNPSTGAIDGLLINSGTYST